MHNLKNNVTLIGNTTSDVKIHNFANGSKMGFVTLAINDSWTDKVTGEKKEKTTFIHLTLSEKQSDIFEKYVSKGSPLVVSGSLKTYKKEVYTEHQEKISIDLVSVSVDSFHMLPKQSKNEYTPNN